MKRRSILFLVFLIVMLIGVLPISFVPNVQASPDQETLDPNEAGTYQQWDLSDTSHWGATSDDSDSTYLYTDVVDEKDFQGLTDPAFGDGATINWVQINFRAYVSGTGAPEKVFNSYRANGVDYDDIKHTIIDGSWNDYMGTQLTTYDNTNPWTKAIITSMEAGVNVDTIGSGEDLRVSKIWVVVDYTPSGDGDGWWDSNWSYRMKLTFDNTASNENFTDFPVMVWFNSSHLDFWSHVNTSTDYADLRFVDDDDSTELYFEVEYWNDTEQSTYIWVEVPQLTNTSTDFIYTYYGNPTASESSYHNAAQVWDSNFTMVHHFQESGSPLQDSTTNNNDATAEGTPSYLQSGQIDDAVELDGSDNENFVVSDSAGISTHTNKIMTFEVWYYPTGTTSWDAIMEKASEYTIIWNRTGNEDTNFGSYGANIYAGAQGQALNTWHQTVIVWDQVNDQITIWVDGVLKQDHISFTDPSSDSTNELELGDADAATGREFTGRFDEFRISQTERSGDWIYAQWLTMKNNFITYGPEEGGIFVTLNSPTENVTKCVSWTVQFNFTPTISSTIENASFHVNETNWSDHNWNTSAVINNTENSISYTFSQKGTYIWNVEVFNQTQSFWANSNRTIYLGPVIFVFGGRAAGYDYREDVIGFSIEKETWENYTFMPVTRSQAVATYYDNKIYIIGGANSTTSYYDTVLIYDIVTDSWSYGTAMPTARGYLSHYTAPIDDVVYVLGGRFAGGARKDTNELYNFTSDSWNTTPTNLPETRSFPHIGMNDGKLYVVGGSSDQFTYNGVNWTDMYDPDTNGWTDKADLPVRTTDGHGTVFNGKFHMLGGWFKNASGNFNLDTHYSYNFSTDTWTDEGSLPSTWHHHGWIGYNGEIWLLGGVEGDDRSIYRWNGTTWTDWNNDLPSYFAGIYNYMSILVDLPTVEENFYGLVNTQFGITFEKVLDFARFALINPTFSINSIKSFAFNLFQSLTILFSIESSHTIIFSIFASILQTFGIAFTKTFSFSLFPAIISSFTIESVAEFISEQILALFGAINTLFAINSIKSLTFTLLASINPTFSISGVAEIVSAQILNFFGAITQAFSISLQKTLSFNRFGSVIALFDVSGLSLETLSIFGAVAQTFTITSLNAFTVTLFKAVTMSFTVNSLKTVAFTLFSVINSTFSIYGTAEITSAQILNLFGSIIQAFTLTSQRGFSFNLFGVITSQFTITSVSSFSQILNLFGAVATVFTISATTLFYQSLNLFGSITQLFSIALEKTMAFTLFSTINPTFAIASVTEFISGQILNLFGSIAQAFTIAFQKTVSFSLFATITSLFNVDGVASFSQTLNLFGSIASLITVATATLFSQTLNLWGAITQAFTIASEKAVAFSLVSVINPTFSIVSLTEITQPGILNFFGSIATLLGIGGWTDLPLPTVDIAVTTTGFAIVAFAVAICALALALKRREPTIES